MKHGKESYLIRKFEKHHTEALSDSRIKKIENDTKLECNRLKIDQDSLQGCNDGKKIYRNRTRVSGMHKASDYLF